MGALKGKGGLCFLYKHLIKQQNKILILVDWRLHMKNLVDGIAIVVALGVVGFTIYRIYCGLTLRG